MDALQCELKEDEVAQSGSSGATSPERRPRDTAEHSAHQDSDIKADW